MADIKLNSIEDAVKDFQKGKFVIVVDDEDRENEGDLIIAAEKIDAEKVNFMLKNARGVLCAPITLSRCEELDLPHQVSDNTSMLGTPFTVTVDKLEGCSTGVSAHDRAETIKALADPASTPQTFGRPGHINPLYAQDNGVLRRSGHTEAAIDLCRMAGLYPAGPHGDHERRWNHGTPSTVDGDGKGMEPQDHLYQGYDRVQTQEGIAHRGGRRGRYAYRIRTLPSDSFPPGKQRT